MTPVDLSLLWLFPVAIVIAAVANGAGIGGVIIGGQLGPAFIRRVPEQRLIRSLGWLFFAIAGLTIFEAFAL